MTEATARRQPSAFRLSRRRAVGLALAGLLAGCSTVVPRTAPPARTPPPPEQAARPAMPSALPEDVARQRVALLVPLSGRNAAVGRAIADAATLAIVDTRDKALRVTTYDTGEGGATAVAAAQRAIAEGNRLILGPLLAEDVRAVAAPAAAAHVPVVAFSNDASAAGEGVWVLGFQPAQSIDRVVRYAAGKGLTRFAGLVPAGSYGRAASTSLIHAAEEAGGTVVTMQVYDRSPKRLAAIGMALARQKYDAALIADNAGGAALVAPVVRKAGGQGTRLLGTELWLADGRVATMPALAGAWYAGVDGQMFDQLSTRFVARYGHRPMRLASLGYDAVLLTIRIAADWKMGRPFPADRLSDPAGFAGVDGAFRFNTVHVAERALAVHQIGEGVISPAPRGF